MNRKEAIHLMTIYTWTFAIGLMWYLKAPDVINYLNNILDENLTPETIEEKTLENRYNFHIIGDTSSKNIQYLADLFNWVSPSLDTLWQRMKQVRYIELERYNGDGVIGDWWQNGSRTMHVELINSLSVETAFVHETSHAHLDNLPRKNDFIRTWKQTMTPDYFGALGNIGADFVNSPVPEDIAVLDHNTYFMRRHLNGGGSPSDFFTTAKPNYFYVVRDIIGPDLMSKKIDLLREGKFISDREYRIMKPLIDLRP